MGGLRAGVGLVGLALFLAPVVAVQAAVPSPVVHVHTGDTVHWKDPGSPGLPWDHATANSWNHNHLTADPFTVAGDWVINKAWDNRTLDSSLGPGGSPQFGHGLIEATTPVRYGWGAAVPEAAKTAVETVFNDWKAVAIDYTYSIPEASTWMGAGVLVFACALRFRRGGSSAQGRGMEGR